MKRTNRVVLLAAASLATTALLAPQVASAKTVKVTIKSQAKDPSSFENISASLTGTLGKGSQAKCCIRLPKLFYKWKFKGGTIVAEATSTLKGSKAVGTWKITKGKSTGKFKGATGKGTLSGELSSGKYVYKGVIKY